MANRVSRSVIAATSWAMGRRAASVDVHLGGGRGDLVVLGVRFSEINATLAAVGVLMVVAVNVFAVSVGWMAIRLIDNQIRHHDLEPLTGLLNRTA